MKFFLLIFIPFKIFSSSLIIIYSAGMGELQWAKRIEYSLLKKGYQTVLIHEYRDAQLYGIGNEKKQFLICINTIDSLKNKILKDYENFIKKENIFEVDDKNLFIKNIFDAFKPALILELNRLSTLSTKFKRVLFVHTESDLHSIVDKKISFPYKAVVLPDYALNQFSSMYPNVKAFEGYPFHHETDYRDITFKELFYCGASCDSRRNALEMIKMLRILEKNNLVSIYGPPSSWAFFKTAYKGFLDFESDAIIRAIQASGITLILHTKKHIKSGIPTSRIFEAAAASSVIICDKHPFVIKNFEDSVFYLDNSSCSSMLLQILKYITWIKNNPEAAKKMARRSFDINRQKFSLDVFLENLISNINQEG